MPKVKPCKIEQDRTYPCPCRKQGQLYPIALTEALGCSKCHYIFVISADGYTLEQLSGASPYKQLWYWTGQDWAPIKPLLKESGCIWTVGISSCLLILLLCLTRVFARFLNSFGIGWFVLGIFTVSLVAVLVWRNLYRRL